nr:MAG TPA: hypothetical protein [Bacteriophage sp.]
MIKKPHLHWVGLTTRFNSRLFIYNSRNYAH